jgi:hypothetical protein
MGDLENTGRAIVDAASYMVLGTADASGRPWASPVWFALEAYRELFWVSSPEVDHSRNIAVRPEISIVVFDSQQPVGTGQAVYMSCLAEQIGTPADERAMEIFSRRSLEQGQEAWPVDRVREPEPLRVYRASVTGHWMLDKSGAGPRYDHRTPVEL